MPRSAGDDRSVDVVHRLVDAALEDAVQGGDREQAGVVLGERTVRRHHDPARAPRYQSDRQPSELGGERDERAEHLEVGLLDHRDVDGRPDELAVERRRHLLGDDQAGPILSFRRRTREMRRHDDLLEPEQRPGIRLRLEHVERRARHLPRAQRIRQCGLVDQAASCGVHDAYAFAHTLERISSEQPARPVVEREVQGDQIRLGVQLLRRRGGLDSQLPEAVERNVRVVGHDPHAQAERAAGYLPADPPEAHDPEGLPRELDTGEPLALPSSRGERGVCLGHVARNCEEQRDGVLGCRDDGRLGRVRDHDAPPGRRVHVDVVDPHPRSPDDLQAACPLDEPGVEVRPRADDDRLELTDDRSEIGVGILDHVEARAEQLEPGFGDGLPDQDARPWLVRH